MNSVYQAALNFTSQNIGAGKKERIPLILRDCLLIVSVIGAVLGGLAVFFGKELLSIYSSDPEILPYGLERIRVICLTYLLCGLMDVTCGVVRGMGAAVTPTIVSLTGACVLRVIWIYTVFASFHTLFVLYLSYPVTWVITCAVHLICFSVFYGRLRRSSAVSGAGLMFGLPVLEPCTLHGSFLVCKTSMAAHCRQVFAISHRRLYTDIRRAAPARIPFQERRSCHAHLCFPGC